MKKTFVIIVAMSFIAEQALAGRISRAIERGRQTGTAQAAGISSGAQSGQGTQNTNNNTLQQSSQETMKNSQKGQTVATIIKVATAAIGVQQAMACSSQCYSCCGIAAVMFVMAFQSNRAANSFNGPIDESWRNSCTYSSLGCGGGTPENPYTAGVTPPIINQGESEIQRARERLSRGGFTVDVESGKIRGPKGEMNANDPASLQAGLGSEAYDKMMGQVAGIEADAKKKVEQVNNKNVTAALGFDGGGGGAVAAVNPEGYGQDGTEGGGGSLASKMGANARSPASSKGLTKNFNGEPIGVAADSIFEMMSRRYQLKSTQKTFFSPAEVQ